MPRFPLTLSNHCLASIESRFAHVGNVGLSVETLTPEPVDRSKSRCSLQVSARCSANTPIQPSGILVFGSMETFRSAFPTGCSETTDRWSPIPTALCSLRSCVVIKRIVPLTFANSRSLRRSSAAPCSYRNSAVR